MAYATGDNLSPPIRGYGYTAPIVGMFDLLKTEIRRVAVRPCLHGGHPTITVPIDVLHDPFSGDMFTVFYIEAAVIVPWIIGPVFAEASIVPC